MQHDQELECGLQHSSTIKTEFDSQAGQMIHRWTPAQLGSDLIELGRPGGERPSIRAVCLSLLGYGLDNEAGMLRTEMTVHHSPDISRLPATSPNLLDLPAEVGTHHCGFSFGMPPLRIV